MNEHGNDLSHDPNVHNLTYTTPSHPWRIMRVGTTPCEYHDANSLGVRLRRRPSLDWHGT